MIYLLWAVAAAASVYQLVALAACIRHALRRDPEPRELPGISVLKPIRGADPQLHEAISSNTRQDYPEYEVLAASALPGDAGLGEAERAGARVVPASTPAPNGKVGVLIDLNAAARYPVRVISDADIVVPGDYLRRIAGNLERRDTAAVTCLYRARAKSWPERWEALGIATDFTPSALVAPLFGVDEFAFGSTIAYRAADLDSAGGLEPVAPYIADDYQIGKRLAALGRKVRLARFVVETSLHGGSWKAVWDHQVRWARTIRLSRGAYAGLPVTNASLWAILLGVGGYWAAAAGLVALRMLTGLAGGVLVLDCPVTRRWWWLMPARDLWGFAVWCAGMFGNRVVWRDRELLLDRLGRIIQE